MRLRAERRDAARRRFLDRVVRAEAVLGRLGARRLHQLELDPRVANESFPRRRRLALVRISRAEIFVQDRDLTLDLRVGNVLLRRLVYDVDHRLDGYELTL